VFLPGFSAGDAAAVGLQNVYPCEDVCLPWLHLQLHLSLYAHKGPHGLENPSITNPTPLFKSLNQD
jgi:hypothetical protein